MSAHDRGTIGDLANGKLETQADVEGRMAIRKPFRLERLLDTVARRAT